MLKEFRDFLLRGNIVELAVAFVIGVAFATVVDSFVRNLLFPVASMIVGSRDATDNFFTINDSIFRYGAFMTDLITFVAIGAAVFFVVVKPMRMIQERRKAGQEEAPVPDEERRHQELLAAIRGISR